MQRYNMNKDDIERQKEENGFFFLSVTDIQSTDRVINRGAPLL